MSDLKVFIGGRSFNISCNPGEESAAQESANFLNQEAELLQNQLGRLPEDKMLLLSGLLLGDKIRALRHEQSALKETLLFTQTKLNQLNSQSVDNSGNVDEVLSDSSESVSVGSSEEKALLELQSISDMLDDLIRKISIPNQKEESKNNEKTSGSNSQDSFL